MPALMQTGTIFFIGILLPYNDKRLLNSNSTTASSPLTIALTDAGILPAAHLINALIVISVISAGNSSLYVASRTLLFMSRNGKAPKFIGRANKAGVPWVGLIFTNIFACIVFLGQSSSAGQVFEALITLSGGTSSSILQTVGSLLTSPSIHLHRLVRHRHLPHPLPPRPRRTRTRPRKTAIQSPPLPMGYISITGSQYLSRLLPRIHVFLGPL